MKNLAVKVVCVWWGLVVLVFGGLCLPWYHEVQPHQLNRQRENCMKEVASFGGETKVKEKSQRERGGGGGKVKLFVVCKKRLPR